MPYILYRIGIFIEKNSNNCCAMRYFVIKLKRKDVDVMTIGDRIRKARIEKGLTLESVGDLVGVTRATIQKYENGLIANIPSDKVISIARP